jgi:hypothetical protein
MGQPCSIGGGGHVRDDDEIAAGQRVAHGIGIGQGHGGVGVHDPERLDPALLDGLEHLDRLEPGLSGIAGLAQKPCTAARWAGFSISRWQASMLASPPTSRPPMALGWPVTENGPMPGLPMRPVARWQFRIAFTLSVPLSDWLIPCE